MEKYECICVLKDDVVSERHIQEINERLKALGVRLEADHNQDGSTALGMYYSLPEKNPHGAGRKLKKLNDTMTVKDVREYMKKYGRPETCKLLGCSQATLYRRLKSSNGEDNWYI